MHWTVSRPPNSIGPLLIFFSSALFRKPPAQLSRKSPPAQHKSTLKNILFFFSPASDLLKKKKSSAQLSRNSYPTHASLIFFSPLPEKNQLPHLLGRFPISPAAKLTVFPQHLPPSSPATKPTQLRRSNHRPNLSLSNSGQTFHLTGGHSFFFSFTGDQTGQPPKLRPPLLNPSTSPAPVAKPTNPATSPTRVLPPSSSPALANTKPSPELATTNRSPLFFLSGRLSFAANTELLFLTEAST